MRGEKIGAMLLAAGGSRRMGQPKQLLEIGGVAVIHRQARFLSASTAGAVVVVLGAESEACLAALSGLEVRVVQNGSWQDGIASSITAGLSALGDVEAVVIALGDQVALHTRTIDELINVHQQSGAEVVACSYAQTVGPPALFAGPWMERLWDLTGDQGAKFVLQEAGAALVTLPFPGGAQDLDTPADYAEAVRGQV